MDIKCRCGKFARVNMGFEWVCWECRAMDLRGTHEEDWRDYDLRLKAKELGLGKHHNETDREWGSRAREIFKKLDFSLGDLNANHSGK